MSLSEFNLAKFSIPISIKKAFEKGKIDDTYRRMYVVADELALFEAKRISEQSYRDDMLKKLFKGSQNENTPAPTLNDPLKVLVEYREKRLDYHMQNMIHLLEVYAKQRKE